MIIYSTHIYIVWPEMDLLSGKCNLFVHCWSPSRCGFDIMTQIFIRIEQFEYYFLLALRLCFRQDSYKHHGHRLLHYAFKFERNWDISDDLFQPFYSL